MIMPQLSVIMPMRNASQHVAQAIASILDPRQPALELIVVNDGSSDGCERIVGAIDDPRLRVIPGPRTGIAAAFNAALTLTRANIIMRCDADDRYPPDRIHCQLRWLQSHPDFIAVCGSFQTIDTRDRIVSELNTPARPGEITGELRAGITRTHLCAFAIRAAALHRLGGCRPYFVTAEDIDLQLRLPAVGRVWYEPHLVYDYRLHQASITHRQADSHRRFYERTARRFARQRARTGLDDLQRQRPPIAPTVPTTPPACADRVARASVRRHIHDMLLGSAWRQRRSRGRWPAARTNLHACMLRPADVAGWKSLLALLLKS